jgi:hypothetical protein
VGTDCKNTAENYYGKCADEDVFLFTYGSFKDAVSNSGNIVPNDKMVNEY